MLPVPLNKTQQKNRIVSKSFKSTSWSPFKPFDFNIKIFKSESTLNFKIAW